MIKRPEHLMGREKEYPLTLENALNLADHLASVNYVRGRYGESLVVSSGYRPGHYNKQAGGAANSSHLRLLATDFKDHKKVVRQFPDGKYLIGEFANWCMDNIKELEAAELWLEDPRYTNGWAHLQSVRASQRVFIPSATAKITAEKVG